VITLQSFEGKSLLLGWVDGTIDMFNFTFFIRRIQNSMQRLHGLSHSEIVFQKAQFHIISMMLLQLAEGLLG